METQYKITIQNNLLKLRETIARWLQDRGYAPELHAMLNVLANHERRVTCIQEPYFYLTETSASKDPDPDRFAKLFKAVLDNLPIDDHKAMVEYIRKSHRMPNIMLVPELRDARGVPVEGRYLKEHLCLEFYAGIVDDMPEDVLKTLIAHEIGHMLSECVGLVHFNTEHGETCANVFIEKWGYDKNKLKEWEDKCIMKWAPAVSPKKNLT